MTDTDPVNALVGQPLANFYVEKHEHPSGSKCYSALPLRAWVIGPNDDQAVEIGNGPDGCSIQVQYGTPEEIDMAEYGRTLFFPQFRDEALLAKTVVSARIKPCRDGEVLTLGLSDGSEMTYTCYGDDELRPSIDQSEVGLYHSSVK